MALLALVACGPPRPPRVVTIVKGPAALQLVVGDDERGIGVHDLDDRVVERWSATPVARMIGALPGKRGVIAMSRDGEVRLVRPGEDKVVAKVGLTLACGDEGRSQLRVAVGRIAPTGRAICLGLEVPPSRDVVIAVTIDLMTGASYQEWITELPDCRIMAQAAPAALACPLPPRPLAKTIAIEGESFTLVSISPTKRWEVYQGPVEASNSTEVAPIVFLDTLAKQRYAIVEGVWPAALLAGRRAQGAWPANAQVEWLDDDIARLDDDVLVQAGKRVSRPGSFVRW